MKDESKSAARPRPRAGPIRRVLSEAGGGAILRAPRLAPRILSPVLPAIIAGLILAGVFLPLTGANAAAADQVAGPIPLIPGLGNVHHAVSTRNPEAQRYFDQGLALVYGFYDGDAELSFRRAAELDPHLAMAWWGVALALGPDINHGIDLAGEKAAQDAIVKAKELDGGAPPEERAYINALAKRYSVDLSAGGTHQLDLDYHAAMGELSAKYPDDLDAATLYAESGMDLRPWQLWTTDGKPVEGTPEIVSVLESVLRRDPDHIGANHFYIHAIEASARPEYALPSAERLGRLAPGEGHLVHMPAHIYIRIGDYEASAKSNEAALMADRAYKKLRGFYPPYHLHNVNFLWQSYERSGQYRLARRAAEQFMAESHSIDPLVWVLVRFQRWDEILDPAGVIPAGAEDTAARYARGMANAATGRIISAEKEDSALLAAEKNHAGWARDTPGIAEKVLSARIARAKGDKAAELARLEEAIAIQDGLPYDEPPPWYFPVRESLGAAMLRNGDTTGAEAVFREDLKRNPRNGRSLFGLWHSLLAEGKPSDAGWVEQQFHAA
ncbi:MAG TPA: hypothetical protein VFJ58_04780, partial [Armatimonadota bacterium]|nr:hypothetical protein [Armatimonadota bacterium]